VVRCQWDGAAQPRSAAADAAGGGMRTRSSLRTTPTTTGFATSVRPDLRSRTRADGTIPPALHPGRRLASVSTVTRGRPSRQAADQAARPSPGRRHRLRPAVRVPPPRLGKAARPPRRSIAGSGCPAGTAAFLTVWLIPRSLRPSRPSVSPPSVSRPGLSKPGLSKPGLSKPGLSKPGLSKPSVSPPVASTVSRSRPAACSAGHGRPRPRRPARPKLPRHRLPRPGRPRCRSPSRGRSQAASPAAAGRR
jgi:hypothetical protein